MGSGQPMKTITIIQLMLNILLAISLAAISPQALAVLKRDSSGITPNTGFTPGFCPTTASMTLQNTKSLGYTSNCNDYFGDSVCKVQTTFIPNTNTTLCPGTYTVTYSGFTFWNNSGNCNGWGIELWTGAERTGSLLHAIDIPSCLPPGSSVSSYNLITTVYITSAQSIPAPMIYSVGNGNAFNLVTGKVDIVRVK
jgi:hypothetical protein